MCFIPWPDHHFRMPKNSNIHNSYFGDHRNAHLDSFKSQNVSIIYPIILPQHEQSSHTLTWPVAFPRCPKSVKLLDKDPNTTPSKSYNDSKRLKTNINQCAIAKYNWKQ